MKRRRREQCEAKKSGRKVLIFAYIKANNLVEFQSKQRKKIAGKQKKTEQKP